jgi:hypothetical protein
MATRVSERGRCDCGERCERIRQCASHALSANDSGEKRTPRTRSSNYLDLTDSPPVVAGEEDDIPEEEEEEDEEVIPWDDEETL